jgi:histidine phosphotransfer protein HptB
MALEQTVDDFAADIAARCYVLWNLPSELLDLGDESVLELVTMFRTDTARRLSRICDLHSKADFDGVKAAAHNIKGSARQMGADGLASVCEEVEAAIREASASKLEEGVARLRAVFWKTDAEMGAFSARVETTVG